VTSLPPWIGAAVAVVVGTFTILNVRTARRAYLEGSWDRKVAVARLVWSEAQQLGAIEAGAQIPDRDDADLSLAEVSLYKSEKDAFGNSIRVARTNCVMVRVVVTNGSNEPMTNVFMRVHDAVGGRLIAKQGRIGVLRPGTTYITDRVVPSPDGSIMFSPMFSTIRFRDSAGHRWERKGTAVPEVIEDAGETSPVQGSKVLDAIKGKRSETKQTPAGHRLGAASGTWSPATRPPQRPDLGRLATRLAMPRWSVSRVSVISPSRARSRGRRTVPASPSPFV
jgi:hypothetical protein